MIQPVLNAINAFLGIYNLLPFAVRAFASLSLLFLLLLGVRNIWRS